MSLPPTLARFVKSVSNNGTKFFFGSIGDIMEEESWQSNMKIPVSTSQNLLYVYAKRGFMLCGVSNFPFLLYRKTFLLLCSEIQRI